MNKGRQVLSEGTKPFGVMTGGRSGQTTRRIDQAIQLIFAGYTVVVKDHHGTKEADEDLFRRILRRLSSEHDLSVSNGTVKGFIKADINKLEIELEL